MSVGVLGTRKLSWNLCIKSSTDSVLGSMTTARKERCKVKMAAMSEGLKWLFPSFSFSLQRLILWRSQQQTQRGTLPKIACLMGNIWDKNLICIMTALKTKGKGGKIHNWLMYSSSFSRLLNDSINSILPHLYRDPANASPDGSASLFLMNDSKTTGCRERRENREKGFDFLFLLSQYWKRQDREILWPF